MSIAPPGSPHPLPIRPSIFKQGCHPHALIIDGGNAVSIGVVALVGGVLLGYKFFVAILVLRPSMHPGCAREHRERQCCALNTFTARCTRDFANEPLSSTYRLDPRDDIDGDGRSLEADHVRHPCLNLAVLRLRARFGTGYGQGAIRCS
jgi:hypothetical protein